MASVRSIALLVILFLTVFSLSSVPDVSATDYAYKESYILHPNADISSTWTSNPGGGVFWDKVGSNDGNTTTIFSTAVNQVCRMNFADFSSIPDEAISNHSVRLNVTLWVITRSNVSGSALAYQIVILTYGYQQMWTGPLGASPAIWRNYSLRSTICTYHQDEWWPNCINYTTVTLTSLVAGKMIVTEVGLQIDVYIPIPYSPGFVITLETIGIIVTLALAFGCMAFGYFRREFNLIAGLVWIFGGIFFLTELQVGFTIISIGLGVILLLGTAVDYLGPKETNQHIRH